MNIEEIRDYCLAKEGADEALPFDEDTLVFRVNKKMFLLVSLENPNTINLKCNPERAVELREHYPEITPGYHMNKIHWNTVALNGGLTTSMVKELIDHSYQLVKGKK
jgi:predicted DNA-binding protein (MmcQ/YjbR family)